MHGIGRSRQPRRGPRPGVGSGRRFGARHHQGISRRGRGRQSQPLDRAGRDRRPARPERRRASRPSSRSLPACIRTAAIAARSRLDGKPYHPASVAEAEAAGVALVPQEVNVAPDLTVAENMYLNAEPTRWGFLDQPLRLARGPPGARGFRAGVDPAAADGQPRSVDPAAGHHRPRLVQERPAADPRRADRRPDRGGGAPAVRAHARADRSAASPSSSSSHRLAGSVRGLGPHRHHARRPHLRLAMPPPRSRATPWSRRWSAASARPSRSAEQQAGRDRARRSRTSRSRIPMPIRRACASIASRCRPRMARSSACSACSAPAASRPRSRSTAPGRARSAAASPSTAARCHDRQSQRGRRARHGPDGAGPPRLPAAGAFRARQRACWPASARSRHRGFLDVGAGQRRRPGFRATGSTSRHRRSRPWSARCPAATSRRCRWRAGSIADARILILIDPTRGVDVGARAEIKRVWSELRADGRAIVIASTDAEELVDICDRVLVFRRGAIAGELTRRGTLGGDLAAGWQPMSDHELRDRQVAGRRRSAPTDLVAPAHLRAARLHADRHRRRRSGCSSTSPPTAFS